MRSLGVKSKRDHLGLDASNEGCMSYMALRMSGILVIRVCMRTTTIRVLTASVVLLFSLGPLEAARQSEVRFLPCPSLKLVPRMIITEG